MFQRFLSAKVTIGLPKLAAVILACVGGVAQVLNYKVIPASTQLHAAIAVGLLFLTGLGVPPLTGSQFQAAIHLPPWASYVVSAAMSAAMLALTSISMSGVAHAILASAITVFSTLGFSASVEPIPVAAPTGKVRAVRPAVHGGRKA